MIGDRISLLIKKLGISQKVFASKIYKTEKHISHIINGKTNLSNNLKDHICSTFNVNPVWLETGEGEMFLKTEPIGAGLRDNHPEYGRYTGNPELQQYHDMLDTILEKGSDTMKSAIKSNLVAFHQAVDLELNKSDTEERHKEQIADQEDRLQKMQKEFEALKAFVSSLRPDSNSRSPASGVRASLETPGDHKT